MAFSMTSLGQDRKNARTHHVGARIEPVQLPFIGSKLGELEFENLDNGVKGQESNQRWRRIWFIWAMSTTASSLIFLGLFICFAVLYSKNQHPQCSLKNMHFSSAVTHTQSIYPILQYGTAFYRNAAYAYTLTSCEKSLLQDLENLPSHTAGPLNGMMSNT